MPSQDLIDYKEKQNKKNNEYIKKSFTKKKRKRFLQNG